MSAWPARLCAIAALAALGGALVPAHALGTCLRGSAWFELHPAGVTWFDTTTVAGFGWLGPLVGQGGWYANLTGFWLAIAVMRPPRWSVRPLLAGHAMFALWACLPVPLAHNEAFAEPMCLAGYGPGFALWLGWVVLIGVAAWLNPGAARPED